MPVQNHQHWMAEAIRQANKGRYSTHPNPRVGCVVVRDGEMVASGYHEFPGGPHAEINALAALKHRAEGCTVYVTLEPCSHTGKTPPCADALIQANPKTVVVGMTDPNPLVSGRGIDKLRAAGIEVIVDVMAEQCRALNPGFIKRMTLKRPQLRLKMAMSLDGRTALANGLSQWITGEAARRDVQYLRASSSAILSTAQTVLADDAALTVRLDEQALGQQVPVRQPVRIIIDSQARLTGREKLFSDGGDIWIFTTHKASHLEQRFSRAKSRVRLFEMPETESGINLGRLMDKLAELEINEIHSECGPRLAGALLSQGLVDEMVVYMAPSLLGSASAGLVDVGEISIMSDKISLDIRDVRIVGSDIRITAKPEV
jgi:diaminohydroxyphosphoribosylaminopyrimidine deaminase/5-amino-6-(5-phosphoribosylamino)uracil reductase